MSRARLPYTPALDGLRGLAVAAVLLFHGEIPGVPGGHLGVLTGRSAVATTWVFLDEFLADYDAPPAPAARQAVNGSCPATSRASAISS